MLSRGHTKMACRVRLGLDDTETNVRLTPTSVSYLEACTLRFRCSYCTVFCKELHRFSHHDFCFLKASCHAACESPAGYLKPICLVGIFASSLTPTMSDPAFANTTHTSAADDTNDRVLIDLRGSDVTLISCDKAKFRVHQNILAVASPVFEGMFDLATSSTPTVEVPMVESASVLETLIRFLYPISPRAELVTIDQARPVLEAARKFELRSVQTDICRHLRDILAKESNPLRAWALAISFGDETARQSAMLRILCVNDDQLPTLVTQAVEDFRCVSARDYVLLLQWRMDAVKEAREIIMICGTHRWSTGALSDICGSSANPFILWDYPNEVVHVWLENVQAKAKFNWMCKCASPLNLPESVTYLFGGLRPVMNRAKG